MTTNRDRVSKTAKACNLSRLSALPSSAPVHADNQYWQQPVSDKAPGPPTQWPHTPSREESVTEWSEHDKAVSLEWSKVLDRTHKLGQKRWSSLMDVIDQTDERRRLTLAFPFKATDYLGFGLMNCKSMNEDR